MSPQRNGADWEECKSLFARYLEGEQAAARQLFGTLTKVLSGYYYARIGHGADAEDLIQATLLKIHFARDRYDLGQPLKTWVFTIASRSLIDHWRGAQATAAELVGETEDEALETLTQLPSKELTPEEKTMLHGDLNQALSRLKPLERSIVYLYAVEGLSMAEIAQTHGLSEGAVKLRAHRAYVELRKHLGTPEARGN